MSLSLIAVFVHVSGAIGICVSLGIWLFGLAALRRAHHVEQVRALAWLIIIASPFMVGSVLLMGLAGFSLALSTWGLQTPWIAVALVSVVVIAPIGPWVLDARMRVIFQQAAEEPEGAISDALFTRTHDPVLGTSVYLLVAILLGIVFLMTTKPPLATSILVMVAAPLIGLLLGAPLWSAARLRSRRMSIPVNHAEADPFLKKTLWTRQW